MLPICQTPISVKQALSMSAVSLAFIGDSVDTLAIRAGLCMEADYKISELHRRTSSVVNAAAQAMKADAVFLRLNENEQAVFMRARNAKPKTVPKNADIIDYKKATAYEAVVGFLFLTGQTQRHQELFGQTTSVAKI